MIVEIMSVPLNCGIFYRIIMMQFNLSAFDRKLRAIGHGLNPISFRTYTCTSSVENLRHSAPLEVPFPMVS